MRGWNRVARESKRAVRVGATARVRLTFRGRFQLLNKMVISSNPGVLIQKVNVVATGALSLEDENRFPRSAG